MLMSKSSAMKCIALTMMTMTTTMMMMTTTNYGAINTVPCAISMALHLTDKVPCSIYYSAMSI